MKTYQRMIMNFLSDMEWRSGDELYRAQENKYRDVCTVPCSKINAFFRTWLIYSCKGRCCPYTSKKCKLNGKTLPNAVTPTEFAFYTFLGVDYTNNTIRNIIRRLDRFIHILKYEDGEFESVFKEFVDNDGNTFRPVLRNKDNFKIINKYSRIFDFLKIHIDDRYKDLIELFKKTMQIFNENYDRIDKNKGLVTNYLTKDIFFSGNQEIDDLREKVLVLIYISVYRFYEIIDIDTTSGTTVPDANYINNFFKPERVFVSSDIVYIVLHNKKSILIYDILGKIESLIENEEFNDKNFISINKLRGIYLYTFENEITSIHQDVYNVILGFKNNIYKICGSNYNHKISQEDTSEYFFFREFITGDSSPIIKTHISKHYIIQIKENGNIFFHGNPVDGLGISGFNTDYPTEYEGVYKVLDRNEYLTAKDFFLSENEEYFTIIYDTPLTPCDYILGNNGEEYFFEDDTLKIKERHSDEVRKIKIEPRIKENIVKVHRLISIRKDGFILECIETNGENREYRYFSYGDNTDSRLGYTYNEESREEDLKNLHEITEDVCVDLKGNIDRTARIEKIVSYSKRLIILNSNSVVLGSGRNSGYFCDLPGGNNENLILEKFTKIVNNTDIDSVFDMVCNNDKNGKPIVLLHNKYRVYCFGSIHYRGFKNGGGYIEEDEVVESKNNNEAIYRLSSNFLSLFCSQRCIYSQNAIFDILAYNLSFITSDTTVDYFDYKRFINTINYLKDITVKENMYNGFETKVNNIENTSDSVRNLSSKTISGSLSELKAQDLANYLTSRYMIKDYLEEKEYSYFGAFINYLVMIAECKKYLRIEEVNERGNCSKAQFEANLVDINQELPYDKEDRINEYIR